MPLRLALAVPLPPRGRLACLVPARRMEPWSKAAAPPDVLPPPACPADADAAGGGAAAAACACPEPFEEFSARQLRLSWPCFRQMPHLRFDLTFWAGWARGAAFPPGFGRVRLAGSGFPWVPLLRCGLTFWAGWARGASATGVVGLIASSGSNCFRRTPSRYGGLASTAAVAAGRTTPARPAAKMLIAAFRSLLIVQPHVGH